MKRIGTVSSSAGSPLFANPYGAARRETIQTDPDRVNKLLKQSSLQAPGVRKRIAQRKARTVQPERETDEIVMEKLLLRESYRRRRMLRNQQRQFDWTVPVDSRRMTKFATAYEDQFAEAVMQHSIRAQAIELRELQKSLASLQARDQELDKLFERIYEDNVSGKLTDERFTRMSQNYDAEQKALSVKIKETKATIDSLRSRTFTKEMFLSAVRKYTRAEKLSREMLNALIDHIEVHQAEKINGVWEQRLTIHCNGV